MDNAVALVRAYLHVNGYFTVTEYPVLEVVNGGEFRTVTDIDVLAFRFAGAGSPSTAFEPDPELGVPGDRTDMVATTPSGHQIRLAVFASAPQSGEGDGFRVISLRHVVRFLQKHLEEHRDVLHHAQFKDPAFGFLMTLRKALGSSPESAS